jgi:hypothetical protein
MSEKTEMTKVKKQTIKIGVGESNSKSAVGEFTVQKIKHRTVDAERRTTKTEWEVVGTTGHVSNFRTTGECLNFIQLVFKRIADPIAFKLDKLEFVDDGSLSRAEKTKLETVGTQLAKVIETMDGIKRICLSGDIGSGTLNSNVFAIVDNDELTTQTKIDQITDMIAKGRESEFWKS